MGALLPFSPCRPCRGMFFHDINHEDFIELLRALPSTPAMTRAHIIGAFGVLVTGDDPRAGGMHSCGTATRKGQRKP